MQTMLFDPGTVLATPDALQAMQFNEVTPQRLLHRHVRGDWGELPRRSRRNNEHGALAANGTITSRYRLDDGELVLVTTDFNRGRTIISQPGDEKHISRFGLDWWGALRDAMRPVVPWFLVPIVADRVTG